MIKIDAHNKIKKEKEKEKAKHRGLLL